MNVRIIDKKFFLIKIQEFLPKDKNPPDSGFLLLISSLALSRYSSASSYLSS